MTWPDQQASSLMNEVNRLRSCGRVRHFSSCRLQDIWTWQPWNTQEERGRHWETERRQSRSDSVVSCLRATVWSSVVECCIERLWGADGLSEKRQGRDEACEEKSDLHTCRSGRATGPGSTIQVCVLLKDRETWKRGKKRERESGPLWPK